MPLLENFRPALSPDPTDCPWVSEDAFYLAVNNVEPGSGKPWFKKAPVGVNKLHISMKTMAQKAGLGQKLQKPQRQKNYDSNLSQQRRAAN